MNARNKTWQTLNIERKRTDFIAVIILFFFLLSTMLFNHSIIGQASIIAVCIYGLVLFAARGKWKRFVCPFLFSYLIFLFYLLIRVFFFNSFNFSASRAMFTTVSFNLLVYFCLLSLVINSGLESSIFKIYVFASLIMSGFFLLFAFSNGSLFSGRLGSDIIVRIFGVTMTYNSNSIASFATLSLAMILFGKTGIKRTFTFALLIVFVAVILLSGSRRGLILLVFLLVCRFLWNASVGTAIIRIPLFAIVFLLLFLIVTKVPAFYQIIGNRMESFFTFLKTSEGESSIMSRSALIDEAIYVLKRSPFIGVGLANFQSYANATYYTHNDYLELLSGVGIFGLVLCYIPKLSVFFGLIKNKPKEYRVYIILIIMSFISSLLNVSYYKREDWIIFVFAVAAILNSKGRKQNEKTHSAII